MAIDRLDWHAESLEEHDLPYENAATHIGFFLAWIIENHLEGELHREDSVEELELVRQRKMTGRDFLIQMCDEKFWDDDLNEEGLAFVEFYYQAPAHQYYGDYENILTKDLPSFWHVENTWENYDRIAIVITAAYRQWKNSQ